MTSLSLIETKAQQLTGRLPLLERRTLQYALVNLCEDYWHTLRGPQPTKRLAQALWSITPPLADLFVDLYVTNDKRLNDVLPGYNLSRGFALLVLAEIERGNEVGAHIAYEPMMACESLSPSSKWLDRIVALLHGKIDAPYLHRHDRHDSLWKALAVIAAQTKRLDLPAVLAVISLFTVSLKPPDIFSDVPLEKLYHDVNAVGIRFLNIDHDRIHFEQHGHKHKPIRTRQLGEKLLEIRKQWLA